MKRRILVIVMLLVAMVALFVGCPNESSGSNTPNPPAPDVTAPIIDAVSMTIGEDGKTLTVTGVPYTDGKDRKAVIKLGDAEVSGGNWSGNVYTHTEDITSTTSAALTYSVTVTDNAGNESDAVTGVAKGIGGGWAYYAVVAKGATEDVLPAHNVAIAGWYEISKELSNKYDWVAAIDEAYAHENNGKDDWKLPTKAELNAAYVSLYAAGKPRNDTSLTNLLWSSSLANGTNNTAWQQSFFNNGSQYAALHSNTDNVRLVRAFNP